MIQFQQDSVILTLKTCLLVFKLLYWVFFYYCCFPVKIDLCGQCIDLTTDLHIFCRQNGVHSLVYNHTCNLPSC